MNKVCFVNTAIAWGGGEHWQLETILEYKNKVDITLITTDKGKLYEQAEAQSIKTQSIHISNLSFINPFKVFKAYKIIKQLNVKTILFNTSKDFKMFTMPAKWAGVKNILYRRDNGKPMRSHLLNKILLRNGITHFLPCSNYIAKMALAKNDQLFPKQKIQTVYNSINLQKWDETSSEQLFKEEKSFLFGCVGRLSEEKGQLFLPEIAKILKEKSYQFKFIIAGTGPIEDAFKEKITSLNLEEYFEILGFRQDIKSIMSSIDCLVLPSHWEGLPTVALEAMACNKPAISFHVAGNPEVIINNQTGYTVEAFEIEAFANAMIAMIDDPSKTIELGKNGRQLVENTFSRQVTNKHLDQFFIN